MKLNALKPYPRLSFVQGTYESSNFSEELFSNEPVERSIKVSDRAAIVNLMIGKDKELSELGEICVGALRQYQK